VPVSRIDDALRRTQDPVVQGMPADVSQQQFVPAWKVGDSRAIAPVSNVEAPETGPRVSRRSASAGLVRFSSKWRERLAGGPDGDPALVEQFRRLAATLHHAHLNNGLRSVMVTSALPGDGKTLTSVNLALVLADSYRYNVLLIDADLRRPSIPHVVELSEGRGLSEALVATTAQKLALVPITPRLTLLPAGQPVANSIEALTSPRMRQILAEADQRFDWVILDAPPVGPTTDARILTQMVGGTLFVIHAGRTPHPDIQKAIDGVGREQILGIVLNGVEHGPANHYY
jgi:capsular exopolysaccharide synthesis family protein